MMVKEGYKETVIGSLPEEWEFKPLKEVCNFKNGKAIDYYSDMNKGKYYIYGSNGPIGSLNKFNLNSGFIIGRVGAVGEVYHINEPVWVSDNAIQVKLKDSEKVSSKYLYYWLKKRRLGQFATKSAQPLLNQSTVKSIPIPFPFFPEQKKIATILSTVDEAIEKTDKIIDETKQLKKGLMQQLLTKGIGHSEFKEVNLGPMKLEIPKSWRVQKINKLSKELIGGGTPSTEKEKYWRGNIPWITGAFIEDRIIKEGKKYISEEGLKNSSTHVVPKDNILLCTRTAVGNVGINFVNMAISQDVTGIIIDKKAINDEYLVWQIIKFNHLLKSFEQGSTIKGITQKVVKNFEIPLPPLKEQKKIASILSSVENKIQKEKEYKEQLERLKKGLMQKLLTGEIRVNVEDKED
ncbi:MAG: restriction endonuclease subunit S [bacterium]